MSQAPYIRHRCHRTIVENGSFFHCRVETEGTLLRLEMTRIVKMTLLSICLGCDAAPIDADASARNAEAVPASAPLSDAAINIDTDAAKILSIIRAQHLDARSVFTEISVTDNTTMDREIDQAPETIILFLRPSFECRVDFATIAALKHLQVLILCSGNYTIDEIKRFLPDCIIRIAPGDWYLVPGKGVGVVAPNETNDAFVEALEGFAEIIVFTGQNYREPPKVDQQLISDKSLAGLARLPFLEEIRIDGAPRISNRGLAALIGHKSLKVVDLQGTSVTEAGAIAFAHAMPHVEVKLNAHWTGE